MHSRGGTLRYAAGAHKLPVPISRGGDTINAAPDRHSEGPAMTDTAAALRRPTLDDGACAARGRWLVVALLCLASGGGLGGLFAAVLGAGGWNWPKAAMLALYLAGLPWTLLGFWNAVIGFLVLRLARDPVTAVNPAVGRAGAADPIVTRTALAVAVRHEDVERTVRRVEIMLESLEATGWGAAFAVHILSDSSRPDVVAAEEAEVEALRRRLAHPERLFYRRRPVNSGLKAGNVRDFARKARRSYDFMVVLDADSLMSAPAILRLVRVMQANPRLGILQSLTTGMPAGSAFARLFQFGMRQGMRVHTVGAAWWQGDSGPYWGHNAIIRLAPFVEHCRLPVLPGGPPLGGDVLSHDQVEAVLMRRAGYAVRVIPDEFGSWEENPPSLPEFIRRDLRWCQGNMQYLRLLRRLDLRPMGRFQLVNAVLMYLGAPLWLATVVLGLSLLWVPAAAGGGPFPAGLAVALYAASMLVVFGTRLLGVADLLLSGAECRRYGGRLRVLAGSVAEMLFSLLLGPLMTVSHTIFLGGLLFGRRIAWEAPRRDHHAVSIVDAVRGLWPATAFGAAVAALLAWKLPGALPWAVPSLAAWMLAVPFACVTADARFARVLARAGLCAIPEEVAPEAELRRLRGGGEVLCPAE